MGEYAYRVQGKSIFEAQHFPISRAVMASSCVPYGFTPITIDKKYLREQYGNVLPSPSRPSSSMAASMTTRVPTSSATIGAASIPTTSS